MASISATSLSLSIN